MGVAGRGVAASPGRRERVRVRAHVRVRAYVHGRARGRARGRAFFFLRVLITLDLPTLG